MKIIRPEKTNQFLYDKFSAGVLTAEDKLLITRRFHESNRYFMTLQQYEISREWIVWLSSDLFAEFHFEDVWLIFSEAEKQTAEAVYEKLKMQFAVISQAQLEEDYRESVNLILAELENEAVNSELISAAM